MVADHLRRVLGRVAADLREEFGRPAMNRRILYRLASASENDLARLGLTPSDLYAASAPGVTDAASFLSARRVARLEGSRQSSTQCGKPFQFS